MSKHKVKATVSFGCSNCKSKDMTCLGAVRTEDEHVYIMYLCSECGDAVPIELQNLLNELYTLAPSSKLVN